MDRRGQMLSLIRAVKFGVLVATATFALLGAPSQSQAQTGTVHAKIVKAGFIVGAGGGEGTLTYHGRKYHLKFSGISLGTIGIAGVELVGTASNLQNAADIAGSYTAVGAGVALVGGAKVARLQNASGVVLELHGVQVGLDLSLNLSGLTVAVQPSI